VLSTLHTNSAPETTVRLAQMGLDPFSFSDALLGILAQRLARRLCDDCRALEPPEESDLADLKSTLLRNGISEEPGNLIWRARGCSSCRGTGYRGRVALHELLAMNEPLRTAIQQGANADRIREIAVEGGMTTMFQDGLRKCLEGLTDLKQVRAVCGSGVASANEADARA
jgi:type II secretory ATPase GspE/PulE/Tfp pilus assembly ATPase PilB-like protein